MDEEKKKKVIEAYQEFLQDMKKLKALRLKLLSEARKEQDKMELEKLERKDDKTAA